MAIDIGNISLPATDYTPAKKTSFRVDFDDLKKISTPSTQENPAFSPSATPYQTTSSQTETPKVSPQPNIWPASSSDQINDGDVQNVSVETPSEESGVSSLQLDINDMIGSLDQKVESPATRNQTSAPTIPLGKKKKKGRKIRWILWILVIIWAVGFFLATTRPMLVENLQTMRQQRTNPSSSSATPLADSVTGDDAGTSKQPSETVRTPFVQETLWTVAILQKEIEQLADKAKNQQDKKNYSTTQILLKNIATLQNELQDADQNLDEKLVKKTIEKIKDIQKDIEKELDNE